MLSFRSSLLPFLFVVLFPCLECIGKFDQLAPPQQTRNIVPVFKSAPFPADAPEIIQVGATFDSDGTPLTLLAQPELFTETESAVIRDVLTAMQFEPAYFFGEPVPGFAAVRIQAFFVVEDPRESGEDLFPPAYVRSLSEQNLHRIAYFSRIWGEEWFSIGVDVDRFGRVTDLHGRGSNEVKVFEPLFQTRRGLAPFEPATRNGVATECRLRLFLKPELPDDTLARTDAGIRAMTMPEWPSELGLDLPVSCGLMVFLHADHSVNGMILHPDFPSELVEPILHAGHLWRFPDHNPFNPVEIHLLLEPETRNIGLAKIRQVDSTRPHPISQTPPNYPSEMRSARITGKVRVQFIIGSDGEVPRESIEILYSSHAAFSRSVKRAIAKWKYHPATRDGVPVGTVVRLTIPFSFQ